MTRDSTAHPRPEAPRTVSFAIVMGILAFLAAVYSLIRVDILRDRINTVRNTARELENAQSILHADQDKLGAAITVAQNQLANLTTIQQQLTALSTEVSELHNRTQHPQRTWARAEALYLLRLATQELFFKRNVPLAINALETADLRLAALHDPNLQAIRTRIAQDLAALRAVAEPDRDALVAQLQNIATQTASLKLAGTLIATQGTSNSPLPANGLARARALLQATLQRLFTVQVSHNSTATLLTLQEQTLRRQLVGVSLSAAQQAVYSHNAQAYHDAIAHTEHWVQQYFDQTDPAVQAIQTQLQALHAIDIAPPLPSLHASGALARLIADVE